MAFFPEPPINTGTAIFQIGGTAVVGNVLNAVLQVNDPDGSGGFSFRWESSSNGSSWSPLGSDATYTITSNQEGKLLRLAVSYVDGKGFFQTTITPEVAVPFVNNGSARFAISGAAVVGGLLNAQKVADDPDGNGGFSYSWQSSHGASWTPVGSGMSYAVTANDAGRQLRLVVSYTDLQRFSETLVFNAGQVPVPPPPPLTERKQTGLSNATITESPVGGSYSASATLQQQADNLPLLAIGVDESSLDLGGDQSFTDNAVSIAATVISNGAVATAIGLNASTLQLRPGDDTLTIEAAISGAGSGSDSSVAVRESLVSGNRGDDAITLRGTYWGDRALIFGGAGNDTITCFGIGRDSFIQAGDGDDLVSLGRLETTPGAAPLQRAKGDPITPSTYRGGAGFDVLQLRDTTQAEFEAQATPFSTAIESGWLFQGARFSGFEQFLFG